jgi:hypothetical protein
MALSLARWKGIANVVDPDLWEVIKRYTVVGVVLVAASIWTVIYSTDATRQANNAPALEARTAPEALDASSAKPPAPSRRAAACAPRTSASTRAAKATCAS